MNGTKSSPPKKRKTTIDDDEKVEETINIPDEDPSEILKFEDDKIDKNKYKIKHPMNYTIGADLLIKTETTPLSIDGTNTQIFVEADTEQKHSETWLIPVHTKVMSAEIPYFGAMFRNDWRNNEVIGSTQCVSAPDHISAKVVLEYIATKYYFIDPQIKPTLNWIIGDSSDSEFDADDCLECFDLATFWSDETMKNRLLTHFEKNMTSKLVSKIYDHPRLHDILKPIVLKHFEKLESAAKSAKNLLDIEKKKHLAKREFFWFQTTEHNGGLQVYSGRPTDQSGVGPIYKIRAVTSFKKLMISFCTQQGLMIDKRRFTFGDRVLIGSDTAETLELKDGDVIAVSQVDLNMAHLE